MDPVSLVCAALVAGAKAGLGDAAKSAVTDSYHSLRELLLSKLGGSSGEVALEELAKDPDGVWVEPAKQALERSGAAADLNVVQLAQTLLNLIDPDGALSGKYSVNVANSQGVIIGDGAVQYNNFGDK